MRQREQRPLLHLHCVPMTITGLCALPMYVHMYVQMYVQMHVPNVPMYVQMKVYVRNVCARTRWRST